MSGSRQRIAALLRRTGVLPLVDRGTFVVELLRRCRANRRFLAEHPGFSVPPAELAYDAYHHVHWRAYHDSGILHARLIADLIREHLAGASLRICEWGCGPGRVIRHLRAELAGRDVDLFGTDFNPASVAWCRDHIPGIDFRQNDPQPPLPFDDDTFDAVYAISVFTHLSATAQRPWIDEVFRVVRPSGIVIFTTHGDACIARLLPSEQHRFRAGNLVVRGYVREGSKCFLAYHPPEYVREKMLNDAEIAAFLPSLAAYQISHDVWVARKRNYPANPRVDQPIEAKSRVSTNAMNVGRSDELGRSSEQK